MLGGGNFTSYDKVLPGAYINFVNAAAAGPVLSERGTAAVPLVLDWGAEQEVMEVTAQEFRNHCFDLFGYSLSDPQMKPLRELFQNLTKGVFYRMNTGTKASNDYAEARYSGKRGNDMVTVVSKDVNDPDKYVVRTLLGGNEVDRQTVAAAGELADNGFAVFKKDAELAETAGAPLTGGTDGEGVTGADYGKFLAKMESCSFNTLCCPSDSQEVKALFAAYTRRLRDEAGVKFQTVVYRYTEADHEGIISVENKAKELETGLVYWVTGAAAACPINRSNTNRKYDGEYTVDTDYTQIQLADGIGQGKLLLHQVGSDVRILEDINTLVTYSEEKGSSFADNQTVRVLDQMGNDIASLFNTRYLGTVPNDEAGRISLWNDVVSYQKELVRLRAVEEFDAKEITVGAGNGKKSVVVNCPVTPINCMSQLYMTVVVD